MNHSPSEVEEHFARNARIIDMMAEAFHESLFDSPLGPEGSVERALYRQAAEAARNATVTERPTLGDGQTCAVLSADDPRMSAWLVFGAQPAASMPSRLDCFLAGWSAARGSGDEPVKVAVETLEESVSCVSIALKRLRRAEDDLGGLTSREYAGQVISELFKKFAPPCDSDGSPKGGDEDSVHDGAAIAQPIGEQV